METRITLGSSLVMPRQCHEIVIFVNTSVDKNRTISGKAIMWHFLRFPIAKMPIKGYAFPYE